jgi:hypothetical protein
MKHTLLHDADGLRTFAVVMDKDDEATGELLTFARERGIGGASITAIGACRGATLAYFDPERRGTPCAADPGPETRITSAACPLPRPPARRRPRRARR